MSQLRDNLAAAVQRDGRSLRAIEAAADLGHSTLAKLVNGTSGDAKASQLQAIAAALGTSVGALMGESPAEVQLLPWAALRPSPDNPRRHFDPDALAALADSIHQEGLLQNLVVGPPGDDGTHLIVAGERRWRAIQLLANSARWPAEQRIPCRVVDERLEGGNPDAPARPNDSARITALIENLMREDLRPLEEAEAFAALGRHQWSPQLIARAIHKTDRYVQQRLALLKLQPGIRAALDAEEISLGQARALARANPSEQPDLLKRIKAGELHSEKQIDEAAKAIARQHQAAVERPDGKVRLGAPNAGAERAAVERDEEEDDDDVAPPLAPRAAAPELVPPHFLNEGDVLLRPTLASQLHLPLGAALPRYAPDGTLRLVVCEGLQRVILRASADGPGWIIDGYVDGKGTTRRGFEMESGLLATMLDTALKSGLQLRTIEEDQETPSVSLAEGAAAPLPEGPARRAEEARRAAEEAGSEDLAALAALDLHRLGPTRTLLLAEKGREVVRCNARIAAAQGFGAIDEACTAFDLAVEALDEAFLQAAREQAAERAGGDQAEAPAPAPRAPVDPGALELPAFLDRRGKE